MTSTSTVLMMPLGHPSETFHESRSERLSTSRWLRFDADVSKLALRGPSITRADDRFRFVVELFELTQPTCPDRLLIPLTLLGARLIRGRLRENSGPIGRTFAATMPKFCSRMASTVAQKVS